MWPHLLIAPTLHLQTRQHTLDNGMEVVLLPDRRVPLVASELVWRVGAAEDALPLPGSPGRSGMAHLIEHVLFEGEYDPLLAEAGGESNAWTGHDWTAYTAAAPADALERLLYLESRRMADPLAGVSDDDLDNQLSVVLSERSLARGGGRTDRAIAETLYPPGHPLAGPVLGDPDALFEITRPEVEAFLSAWYQPRNAILVLGGDFDPDEAIESIERWFGGLESTEPPARAQTDLEARSGRWALYEETTPTLLLIWPTVPRGHPDEPALDLLAEVLASGLSSRLGQRVDAGRLDEVAGWTQNGRLAGKLVLSLSHHRRSARALLREADRALDDLLAHPPDAAELRIYQERWRMWYVRRAQGLEARVSMAARCTRETGAPDCIEALIAAREAVTPEDVLDVAQRYLGAARTELTVGSVRRRPLPGAAEVDPL